MWFKRKRFGWGWTPASREGWIVTALFGVAIFVVYRLTIARGEEYVSDFLLWTLLLTVTLIVIAWRTGEPPKWSWDSTRK